LACLSGLMDRPEPVRPADLIHGFDLARVPRRPVTVSAAMLNALSRL